MQVVVFGGLAESLINFRGPLLEALTRVASTHAMAGKSDFISDPLSKMNVGFSPAPIARSGLNPFADFWLVVHLIREWYRRKPDKVLAYTVKPVIWGGITVGLFARIEFYALITGLGYSFDGGNAVRRLLRSLVIALYRLALKRARAVIFQNKDNMALFLRLGICTTAQAVVVNGSGVDLERYQYTEQPSGAEITFLMIARLLGAKGVKEYIEAASIVRKRHPNAVFQFVGPEDPSPDGLTVKVFDDGPVLYLGSQRDVRPFIKNCSVYVLPSYHEGMPRSTMEAMSMGRPIITTDAVGCKDTVVDGRNGFKVPVGDANELAAKMIWCIDNQKDLSDMGRESRELAECRFDVDSVNSKILEIMGLRD
jgi:glycosyltransferase involved in cell wall biosynthesis